MKIRTGFVSNSSSSSFAISLCKLTPEQVVKILNHIEWGKKLNMEYTQEPWSISVESGVLHGDTFMDNFDMREFLRKIGVSDVVHWGEIAGEYTAERAVESCDVNCDSCVMRFLCYTNEW